MAKINSGELLDMVAKKASRREMAVRFGCSMAAISKRLKRLTAEPTEPLKIDTLTHKEKSFVVAVASGESQTHAALKSYDVGSRQSAKSLGHTLMRHEGVKEALAEILERQIPVGHLVKRLRRHVDSKDSSTSLRAVHMGLKLHSAYPTEKKPVLLQENTYIDLSEYTNSVTMASVEGGQDTHDGKDGKK